jgi:cation diffusion facilitator CzcD-associated flavoprotein CzcO
MLEFEAVVVGAGLSGIAMLRRLRDSRHFGPLLRGRQRWGRNPVLEPLSGSPLRW